MFAEFRAILFKHSNSISKVPVRLKSQRWSLGKAPGIARTLDHRLEELKYEDPNVCYKVNIGFSKDKISRRDMLQKHLSQIKMNKSSATLEKAARNNSLIVPLDDVNIEWELESSVNHIKSAAEHYGIFEHLFGDAYFLPVVPIKINYKSENEYPVFRGNVLSTKLLSDEPQVKFNSKSDSLWTLLLTTPDGHLENGEKEYAHWLIGNIKGNDISTGEVLFPYLKPFPMKGLGYLRYIFLLFKQEEMIDFSQYKQDDSSKLDLSVRTFSTHEFYQSNEAQLTPAGLSWFQSVWDSSVTDFFQKKLEFDHEPEFMYDFAKPYYRKQEWFPLRRPFNLYLDRYRDEKEIAKEHLKRKLKNLSPLSPPPERLPFPNAVPISKNTPSWLKNEIIKRRLLQSRAFDYK